LSRKVHRAEELKVPAVKTAAAADPRRTNSRPMNESLVKVESSVGARRQRTMPVRDPATENEFELFTGGIDA